MYLFFIYFISAVILLPLMPFNHEARFRHYGLDSKLFLLTTSYSVTRMVNKKDLHQHQNVQP